jgi:hypothetical protein
MGVDGPVAAGTRWEFSFFTVVDDLLVSVSDVMSQPMVVGQLVKSRISIHLLDFFCDNPSSVLMEGFRGFAKIAIDISGRLSPLFRNFDLFNVLFC